MIQNYCEIDPDGEHFYSSIFNCEANDIPIPAREVECVIDTTAATIDDRDPDNDPTGNMCRGCIDSISNAAETMFGAWTGSTCCGDDIGEGGFVYGLYRTPDVTSTSGLAGAGEYISATNEMICDDYYGILSEDTQIDNDCDGRANCADSNCYAPTGYPARPKSGPYGGYCCGGTNADTNCEATFESHLRGESGNRLAECGADGECVCSAISGKGQTPDDPFTISINSLRQGFTTCIAAGEAWETKYIEITGDLSGTLTATFEKNTFGSGEDCSQGILCYGDSCEEREYTLDDESNQISFKNLAEDDCLVTVTLT